MFNRARPITIKMPVLQTPETFNGGTFKAGLSKDCALLTFYSIVTVFITTLDLTTDWLAFASIRELQLDKRLIDNGDGDQKFRNFYLALPHIFLAVCILASITYAIDVIHYFYKFGTLRKKFYDKRDGVKSEDTLVEKYGGEACVLLLVIFEDLPVSFLILAVLGLVSCHCILMLNTPVLYLCVVATVTSLVWKLIQVLWSSGCCGKRYEYHSNRIISSVRIVSIVLMFSALGVNILNTVLIKPNAFIHLMPQSHHSLFDKVFIDQWVKQDQVIFMETLKFSEEGHHNNPIKMQYSTITSLNDIIAHSSHNAPLTITKKCNEEGSDMNFTRFMTTNDSAYMHEHSECEAMFHFYFNASSETIIYDYGYRILKSAADTSCVYGTFEDTVMMVEHTDGDLAGTSTERIPSFPSVYDDNDPVNTTTNNASTTTTMPPGGRPMELKHHVELISSMATGNHRPVPTVTKACNDIQLAQQSMRSFKPCLFVNSEM